MLRVYATSIRRRPASKEVLRLMLASRQCPVNRRRLSDANVFTVSTMLARDGLASRLSRQSFLAPAGTLKVEAMCCSCSRHLGLKSGKLN